MSYLLLCVCCFVKIFYFPVSIFWEFEEHFWWTETQKIQHWRHAIKSKPPCGKPSLHIYTAIITFLFQARQLLTMGISRHSKLFLIKAKKDWTLPVTLWNIKGKKSRIIKINISQPGQKILNCPVRLLSNSDSMQVRATYRLLKLCSSSNECTVDGLEKQAPWEKKY